MQAVHPLAAHHVAEACLAGRQHGQFRLAQVEVAHFVGHQHPVFAVFEGAFVFPVIVGAGQQQARADHGVVLQLVHRFGAGPGLGRFSFRVGIREAVGGEVQDARRRAAGLAHRFEPLFAGLVAASHLRLKTGVAQQRAYLFGLYGAAGQRLPGLVAGAARTGGQDRGARFHYIAEAAVFAPETGHIVAGSIQRIGRGEGQTVHVVADAAEDQRCRGRVRFVGAGKRAVG